MDKFIHLFDTNDNFESNKVKLDLLSSYIAFSEDDSKIHFKEYKVELPIIDVENSKAADIALYDSTAANIILCEGDLYSKELFPLERYTPIGVVAVPASHAPNGKARVISLAAMDCSNPDSGNTEGHNGVYWGGYGFTVADLPLLTFAPSINTSGKIDFPSPQQITYQQTLSRGTHYLSSDYFSIMQNPFMTDESYHYNRTSNYLPSPYLQDGTSNPIYRDTTNTGNVLADFDGKGNTAKILAVDNSSSTEWQTASTITNAPNDEHIHPAAQCCWRYHTVGTNQGDWYLPSAGEFGYVVARRKAIDASITKIQQAGSSALLLSSNYAYWFSTQFSSNDAVVLDLSNGIVKDFDKHYIEYVRCFLEV